MTPDRQRLPGRSSTGNKLPFLRNEANKYLVINNVFDLIHVLTGMVVARESTSGLTNFHQGQNLVRNVAPKKLDGDCRGRATNRKGCDFGYALAAASCEGATGVDACTVTALGAITAFAVPDPG